MAQCAAIFCYWAVWPRSRRVQRQLPCLAALGCLFSEDFFEALGLKPLRGGRAVIPKRADGTTLRHGVLGDREGRGIQHHGWGG